MARVAELKGEAALLVEEHPVRLLGRLAKHRLERAVANDRLSGEFENGALGNQLGVLFNDRVGEFGGHEIARFGLVERNRRPVGELVGVEDGSIEVDDRDRE